jgi:hypothetical protein
MVYGGDCREGIGLPVSCQGQFQYGGAEGRLEILCKIPVGPSPQATTRADVLPQYVPFRDLATSRSCGLLPDGRSSVQDKVGHTIRSRRDDAPRQLEPACRKPGAALH